MSVIRPFVAWLPVQEYAADVVCPPLGEMTTTEWLAMSHDNPHSFLNVIRTEVDTESGEHDPDFYSKSGRERLDAMVEEGVLRPVDRPAFYVYRIATADHSATALVAAVHVAAYRDGLVVRHEHTRRATEELIVAHLQRIQAHSDPVALAHEPDSMLKELVTAVVERLEPALDFRTLAGSRQSVWIVTDRDTSAAIQARVDGIDRFYITDGHHRCAAAARFAALRDAAGPTGTGAEGYHYFLAALYAEDDLELRAFHRCVREVALTPEQVVASVGSVVDLRRAGSASPPGPGEVVLVTGGERYRFDLPGVDVAGPHEQLDVVRLQRHILGPVFGITDPRDDPRLHYVGAAMPHPDDHGCVACFLLHPTSVAAVMGVADAGLVMPPKSTWFEPKVWGGLFVSSVDVRI